MGSEGGDAALAVFCAVFLEGVVDLGGGGVGWCGVVKVEVAGGGGLGGGEGLVYVFGKV